VNQTHTEPPAGPQTEPGPESGTEPTRIPARGLILLVLLTLAWGVNWPILKIASTGLPLFPFRAICVLGVGILMLSIAAANRERLRVPRDNLVGLCVAGFLNMSVWIVCSAISVRLTTSGHTAITAYTMPLYVFLIGTLFLRERPTAGKWLGLVLGLSAIALLASRDFESTEENWLGIAVMSIGAASWALSSIIVKRVRWGISATAIVGWQCMIGGMPIVIIALPQFFDLPVLPWESVLAMIYCIVIGIALAHWLYIKILQLVPVWVASLSVLTVPCVGLISGAVVLGEPLGWTEVVALLLLVGGVSTVLPRPRRLSAR
jgi:drug/metabolite transporter (DMT)-like permease